MGRTEARRFGLSWDSVKRAKRTLRRTGTLRDGYGERFVSWLKIVLSFGASKHPFMNEEGGVGVDGGGMSATRGRHDT